MSPGGLWGRCIGVEQRRDWMAACRQAAAEPSGHRWTDNWLLASGRNCIVGSVEEAAVGVGTASTGFATGAAGSGIDADTDLAVVDSVIGAAAFGTVFADSDWGVARTGAGATEIAGNAS